MKQCQTMPTNRTISILVTSNINLSQLAEQNQSDSLHHVEQRQAESLVEKCQVESTCRTWKTMHIFAFKVYIISTAWSTKVRSACCQPVTEGHN